jgi:hypothetical protein
MYLHKIVEAEDIHDERCELATITLSQKDHLDRPSRIQITWLGAVSSLPREHVPTSLMYLTLKYMLQSPPTQIECRLSSDDDSANAPIEISVALCNYCVLT